MIFGGKDCVFIIDGMDATEAGLNFAGILGIEPKGKSLDILWRMAEGRVKNRRREQLELASLVWAIGDISWDDYLRFGEMSETGTGGKVKLDPDLQEKVDAEAKRLRDENPGQPQFS